MELESLTEMGVVPKQHRAGGRVTVVKVVAAVALVVTLAANVKTFPSHHGHRLSEFQKYNPSGLTMLGEDNEQDPCADEPQLRMTKISHNNLGGKGPGTGEEGMVFEGTYLDVDGHSKDVELHINAQSDFHPAWVKNLGFHGEDNNFMSINVKAGTEVTVDFKVTLPGQTDATSLPTVDFTFFDVDKHAEGNAEFVKVKDFTSSLTYEGTELEVSETGHWTEFKATVKGTGEDNPTDPLKLTEQQLQRAVTVEFKTFTGTSVTLGNDEPTNTHGRRFDFIGKPSLKCAMGVDHTKVQMTMKTHPQCCLVKIASFGVMCVAEEDAQVYHFMCDPVEAEA